MDRPQYGYDAPGIMRGMLVAGAGLLAASVTAATVGQGRWPGIAAVTLAVAGVVPLFLGVVMFTYSAVGKMRMRDRMLDMVPWTGTETVLDVGTGAGLLLIGAARRLTTGRAIGIDVWATKDLSGDARAMIARNAGIERVSGRCEVDTADARALPMADESFDRVLSLLCLHNIEEPGGQDRACQEIARVLRPGGTALIGDYVPTSRYAAAFAANGLRVTPSRTYFSTALGPMWLVRADKAA